MTELMDNIFQCDIPLEGSPLREIHCYIILGKDRNLLVDTAFNTDACHEYLIKQLVDLGADLDKTDIFLTHMHVDHAGLISRLKTPNNRIYISSADKLHVDNYQDISTWTWLDANNRWAGVPKEHCLKPEEHVAYFYRPSNVVDMEIVEPGQTLNYGGYELELVDLSGHTKGQMGLWHSPSKTLFCGDHILGKVSPNISAWDLESDYVSMYTDRLSYVLNLHPERVFAAHGAPIQNPDSRIQELLDHHRQRLLFIEEIVARHSEPVTAFDVATQMEWSRKKYFYSLPKQQKWFATSETLAHLISLSKNSRLTYVKQGDTLFFGK